jgi:hypothetical protein
MPRPLDLATFRRLLQGKTIDVNRAQKDNRMKGVNFAKADLNHDGQIANPTEITALFNVIRRGSRSIQVHTGSGRQTPAAAMVQAIGEIAGVNILSDMARDDILLVGLNPSSKSEAATLRKLGNSVIFVSDTKDTISAEGTTYHLNVAAELEAFVDHLDLELTQSKAIKAAIESAGTGVRDEVARIAWVWAAGEKGGGVPGRLIISGHSIGDVFWGDNFNGPLYRDTIAKLAKAMTKAAAQVEDLHLAACYCGGKQDLEAWRLMFPRVLTIWAYSGSAPGSNYGAVAHLTLWDRATRGDKKSIDRLIAEKTRKGENVAVWSRLHGYMDGNALEPVSVLQARVAAAEPTFKTYFNGDRTVGNPQTGELRDYYNNVQSLLQHADLPAPDRPAVQQKRDVTIRLIYFEHGVKTNFVRTHAPLIERGYRALGLNPPDFAKLNRKDTLQAIERLRRRLRPPRRRTRAVSS